MVCEWRSEKTVLEFCTLRAPNTPEAWACRGHCPGPSVGQVQHPPGPRPLTACPASSETVGPTGSQQVDEETEGGPTAGLAFRGQVSRERKGRGNLRFGSCTQTGMSVTSPGSSSSSSLSPPRVLPHTRAPRRLSLLGYHVHPSSELEEGTCLGVPGRGARGCICRRGGSQPLLSQLQALDWVTCPWTGLPVPFSGQLGQPMSPGYPPFSPGGYRVSTRVLLLVILGLGTPLPQPPRLWPPSLGWERLDRRHVWSLGIEAPLGVAAALLHRRKKNVPEPAQSKKRIRKCDNPRKKCHNLWEGLKRGSILSS